jgi:hypothetical protein
MLGLYKKSSLAHWFALSIFLPIDELEYTDYPVRLSPNSWAEGLYPYFLQCELLMVFGVFADFLYLFFDSVLSVPHPKF